MTPTWLSKLTIEQLPNSDHRQLEPDSAPPYQPPRCWLPGEHTGGLKERPQPLAPQPSAEPLECLRLQHLETPAVARLRRVAINHIFKDKQTNTYLTRPGQYTQYTLQIQIHSTHAWTLKVSSSAPEGASRYKLGAELGSEGVGGGWRM
jgi:hypothetical protein